MSRMNGQAPAPPPISPDAARPRLEKGVSPRSGEWVPKPVAETPQADVGSAKTEWPEASAVKEEAAALGVADPDRGGDLTGDLYKAMATQKSNAAAGVTVDDLHQIAQTASSLPPDASAPERVRAQLARQGQAGSVSAASIERLILATIQTPGLRPEAP